MKHLPALSVALILALPAVGLGQGRSEAEQHFAREVLPLLKEKCLACHGDDARKLRGELDLRTRAATLRGGSSGKAALVPGKPELSPLYRAVTRKDADLVMPPKDNDRLSERQVEALRRWIAEGAPWPEAVARPPQPPPTDVKGEVVVRTSGGLSQEWDERRYRVEDLWAYRPVRRPTVPKDVVDASRVANPIDAFLQSRLRDRGLKRLAPPAERLTFLRRITFDLTGLPPTPAEAKAFLEDSSKDAETRLVDRLLKSPHYAEQQARHWFDVVRYADTGGFSNDWERPAAWRYRDYVVRSFAADKPFDRFVVEQLAGDELDPDDPEMLVAVGFLRMGPWEHTGMTVAAVTRQQWLDDVTHSVGVTFLGQGLRCAACHDHKFDPVPTRDYYRIQAAFATTFFAERPAPFLEAENTKGFTAARVRVDQRLKDLQARQSGLSKDDRTHLTLRKVYEKGQQYLLREKNRYEPLAFSVYSGPDNRYNSNKLVNPMPARLDGAVPRTHILKGGALDSAGDEVTPGVLSAVEGSNDRDQATAWNSLPREVEGRRLALARWIASPSNTLTARVIVNRVWQQHFGRGLVATPNNFGKMGARPTHPELLDWLAVWFIEHGWSLKKLHRLIVSSSAYRQAGTHPDMERLREIDPKDELLARFPPRRLAAEELRDGMLAVTGELNRTQGGPGVFPEIHWEVALQPRQIMGAMAPAYLPSPTPAERHRRTLYAFRMRTLSDPLLEVFNRPGSEASCERRDETTVTPQSFALFNGEFAHARALALAAAIVKKAKAPAEQVEAAFRLVHGRPPSADEAKACVAHVETMTEHHRKNPPRPRELPRKVRRGMLEELTGELVEWDEELAGLKDYQRDLMPWQVDAPTRGLAELCLVLFNSNEFVYLR